MCFGYKYLTCLLGEFREVKMEYVYSGEIRGQK
jgi:hypothetical protein